MRKLFKKSIACCLALALCFTLFAGAISVNALTVTPTFSTEAVEATQGENAVIKFTVKDFAEIQGVMLKFYVPAVVSEIVSVASEDFEMVKWDDEKGEGNYEIDADETGKFVKFMELANFTGVDTVEGFTFDITVAVAAEADLGVAEYPEAYIAGTDGEAVYDFECNYADFTVVAAEVEIDITEYVKDVTVTYSVADQKVTGAIEYPKAEMKTFANVVNDFGGQITYIGVAMTTDGSDPTTSDTAYVSGTDLSAYWNALVSSGAKLTASAYYYGMNFSQIVNTNVRFATVIKYVYGGETFTVYGTEASGNLYEYLQTQTDDASVALLNAIELNAAATSADVVTGTTKLDDTYGPTFTASYDLATVKSTGKVAYTKAQVKALAQAVDALDGQITYMGIAMTTDGSDPTTSDTAYVSGQDLSAYWSQLLASGANYNASAYYYGMNIAQFASELKFAAMYKYTVDGVETTAYIGDVQTVKFIDQIATDDSELATAYKGLYTSFVG